MSVLCPIDFRGCDMDVTARECVKVKQISLCLHQIAYCCLSQKRPFQIITVVLQILV